MTKELISIIMPTYNSAQTIGASIVSATTQSYENIELIIIDDGSTDQTSEICNNYAKADARIRYIVQDNSGVSAARNTGIKMANGKFIAFLDSDDLWTQDKIELQMAAAAIRPDAVIVTGLRRFSGDGPDRELLSETMPPAFNGQQEYMRTILNLNNHEMAVFGTALVKKEHLEIVGFFDESLTTAEDWDLWLRLALRFPFVNIDQPLRLYRKYSNSLTMRTKLEKTLQGQLYIIDKAASSGKFLPSQIRYAKMRKHLEFANIYQYQSMRYAAILAILKALSSYPWGSGILLFEKLIKKMNRLHG